MTRRKEIDRERVLDAVEEVIMETGGLGLTLNAVVERAGISKGGLVYNFPTKDSLVAAAMAREMARFDRLLEESPDQTTHGRMSGYAEAILNREDDASMRKTSTLLSALLHAPEMLGPAHGFYDRLFAELEPKTEAEKRIRLAMLAVEAVFWLRGMGIAKSSPEVWRSMLQDASDMIREAAPPKAE